MRATTRSREIRANYTGNQAEIVVLDIRQDLPNTWSIRFFGRIGRPGGCE